MNWAKIGFFVFIIVILVSKWCGCSVRNVEDPNIIGGPIQGGPESKPERPQGPSYPDDGLRDKYDHGSGTGRQTSFDPNNRHNRGVVSRSWLRGVNHDRITENWGTDGIPKRRDGQWCVGGEAECPKSGDQRLPR